MAAEALAAHHKNAAPGPCMAMGKGRNSLGHVPGGEPPQPDLQKQNADIQRAVERLSKSQRGDAAPRLPPAGVPGAQRHHPLWECVACGLTGNRNERTVPPGAQTKPPQPTPRGNTAQTRSAFVPQPPAAKIAPHPSPTQSEPSGAPALGTPSPSGESSPDEDSPWALKAATAEAQDELAPGQNSAPERAATPK